MAESVQPHALHCAGIASRAFADLENIERVMNKRYAEKQKAKGKSKEAKPDDGGYPSPEKRSSGGSSERVPKKVCSEK